MQAYLHDLYDLKEDPANARVHSPEQLDAMARSLSEFGQQKPIVINDDNVIIAGNGLARAAKLLGWKHIAVVKTDLPLAAQRAYALVDNKQSELSSWDDGLLERTLSELTDLHFDMEAFGFGIDDIDKPKKERKKKPTICPNCSHEF